MHIMYTTFHRYKLETSVQPPVAIVLFLTRFLPPPLLQTLVVLPLHTSPLASSCDLPTYVSDSSTTNLVCQQHLPPSRRALAAV